MRILYPSQLKVLFPVRAFLLKRSGAITDFYPAHRPIGAEPCILHIAKVFAFRDGAPAKSLAFNGLKQITFRTGLNVSSH